MLCSLAVRKLVAMKLLRTKPGKFPAGLAAQVDSLLRDAFSDDGERYNYGPEPPALIVLLLDARTLVGHLAAYVRKVLHEQQYLTIGLVGGVAVARPYRRHGHARTMLADAHCYFLARKISFSVLFASEPAVYRSSRYREMVNRTRFLDHDGSWKEFVYCGGMVAELTRKCWRDGDLNLCGPTV
jgi:GNAT superfamily N-acetyltransferase